MMHIQSIKLKWGIKQLILTGLSFHHDNVNIIMIKLKLWFRIAVNYALFHDKVLSYVFLMAGWWGKRKSIQLHSLWHGTVSASKRQRDPQGPKPSCSGNARKPWWNEEDLYWPGQEDWHHLPSLLPISLFDF